MPRVANLTYPISSLWNEESNRGQRFRRLLAFAGWQLWKRVVRKPVTLALFNGQKFVAYPDCQVSSGVVYTRIPNSRKILFLRKHLSGGTLVDVGANVGSISLLLADKIQDAILFEPNPIAAERARENLARNHLAFRVFEVALSDTRGEVCFESHGAVDVGGHVVANSTPQEGDQSHVRCLTFDEFLSEHGPLKFPVSLIKIDVEGHENSVLRGMRKFFLDKGTPLVMFEYLERTDLQTTLAFFTGVGYQVFELRREGPVVVKSRAEPLQDLFACPIDRLAAFGVDDAKS